MAVKNLMSSLKPILPQCIQGQLQTSASSSKSILDFDDDVKRWVVIGICLNSVLTPALRKYVTPIVDQMYKSLVKQYHIDNQQFQNYLKKHPPTNTMLNYEPINDNKKLYGRQRWKYDYNVKNPVDLSKLFLQTHMAEYVAFDEACDSSALLAIIINMDQFPLAVQEDAIKVRTAIRNCWAHCNVIQWDIAKFCVSFQLLESFFLKFAFKCNRRKPSYR
ncbi:uncharacterized protein [Mytilus edulis]|uniref:uncharacterized protein isoform X2 n=1 Tax=Mytilus edulis TaxID=6550 RepID=UPI0039EFD04E